MTLIYRDDATNKEMAKQVTQELISQEGVRIIIGGISSPVTLAIALICEEKRTILISPSSSAPEITEAGNYIYRNYPSDILEGTAMAKFARDLGLEIPGCGLWLLAVALVEPLQRQPGTAVGCLQLDLLRHHGDELFFSVSKSFHRGQLLLELAQDQGGAPAEARFRHLDVGEDVVADVEDGRSREAQILLDLGRIAAEVSARHDIDDKLDPDVRLAALRWYERIESERTYASADGEDAKVGI